MNSPSNVRNCVVFVWIGTSSIFQSTYSSALKEDSPMYSRDCQFLNYYYATVEVNSVANGSYSLSGESKVRIYGYIYKDNFNPLNPFENLLAENGYSCGDRRFILTTTLQPGTTYILVVTTFSPNETGKFLIVASGPNHVTLNHFCEYMYYLVYNRHRNAKYRKYL